MRLEFVTVNLSGTVLGLCWPQFAEVVTAFAAAVALVVGFLTFWSSRRALNRRVIGDEFQAYETDEMYHAVRFLHRKFEIATRKKAQENISDAKKRAWIDYYKDHYKDNNFKLDIARRRVSFFYQRFAFWAKGFYVRRSIREFWTMGDRNMVLNILLPIETIAAPELFGRKQEELKGLGSLPVWKYNFPMWTLWSYWKKTPHRPWWNFKKLVYRDWNAAEDHSKRDKTKWRRRIICRQQRSTRHFEQSDCENLLQGNVESPT